MGLRDFFSKKSHSRIDTRIISKEIDRADKIDEAHSKGRYSFFENDFAKEYFDRCMKMNDFDRYITLYNMVEGWDDVCNLSLETGEYISSLWREDVDKIPAIHRANVGDIKMDGDIPTNVNLLDIMKNGLINNGHAMQGGFVKGAPSLSLTATPLDSFTGMINLLASYKNNNVIIVLQFPRLLVDKDLRFTTEGVANTIYNKDGNIHVIKPEYILGVIVKSKEGLDQFYSREQILSVNKEMAI